MAAELGKIYIPSGAAEIRDTWLSDYRLEAQAAGVTEPAVGPGSDAHIIATCQANIGLIQLHNLRLSEDNTSVLTATGDALDEHRQALGLPEVSPTGSSGNIVVAVTGGGFTTIVDGQGLVLPNGAQAVVSGTHLSVANGDEVAIACVTTGASTNLAGGAKVRFITPPLNVSTDALVSATTPLTGGTDEESDPRKRDRILNRLRNLPAGGNWGHVRETILNKVGSLQDAYVYPALGGPGSAKVICCKDFDLENYDFNRAPTTQQINDARSALFAEVPSPQEHVVQSVADVNANVSALLTLPESSQNGGNGKGWVDAVIWPELEVADGGFVEVTTVTSSQQIIVSANTATGAVAGQTHIAWWSATTRKFYKRLVTARTGSAGAWDITLDTPLVDDSGATVQTGDYICPDAVSIEAYGNDWIDIMRGMGPGENTSDANRLPRALRHPFASDEKPSTLSVIQLGDLRDRHREITDYEYGFTPTSPSVPGSVDTAPQILRPLRFGIWKK